MLSLTSVEVGVRRDWHIGLLLTRQKNLSTAKRPSCAQDDRGSQQRVAQQAPHRRVGADAEPRSRATLPRRVAARAASGRARPTAVACRRRASSASTARPAPAPWSRRPPARLTARRPSALRDEASYSDDRRRGTSAPSRRCVCADWIAARSGTLPRRRRRLRQRRLADSSSRGSQRELSCASSGIAAASSRRGVDARLRTDQRDHAPRSAASGRASSIAASVSAVRQAALRLVLPATSSRRCRRQRRSLEYVGQGAVLVPRRHSKAMLRRGSWSGSHQPLRHVAGATRNAEAMRVGRRCETAAAARAGSTRVRAGWRRRTQLHPLVRNSSLPWRRARRRRSCERLRRVFAWACRTVVDLAPLRR